MFIVSPRVGLCNQLQTIVKGVLLGIKYNRNIYIDRFQINLYDGNTCDINEILDISKINQYLITKNISIKILSEIDTNIINNISEFKLPHLDYSVIEYSYYINNFIEDNLNMEVIYLGNIISLCIHKSFNYIYGDYSNLYHLIMSNIVFNYKFYQIKTEIKKHLNLINYTSMHLRVEDDFVKHCSEYLNMNLNEYNKALLLNYDIHIKNITTNIYVCSGILNYDNTLNYDYYINLRTTHKLLCDKSNIYIDDYILKNRELIAIIDLLIAYDSDEFIGHKISSFSTVIKNYLICIKQIDEKKIHLIY